VFGSGLFGSTAEGAAIRNNPDIGNPMYIGWQPGSVTGWNNLMNPIFRNHRFVVQGNIVPEPSTASLFFVASLFVFFQEALR
jgi:hypothetical protein